jgi:hypothetical protein
MAERKNLRARAAAIFAGVVAAGACTSQVDSQSRLLDEACAVEECTTTGVARATTGLTSDSLAFDIGPGPGKVVIPLPAFSNGGDSSFRLEALVSGAATARLLRTSCSGDAGACSTQVEDSSSVYANTYDWEPVGSYSSGSTSFNGFAVEIETTGNQHIELIDLRYDTYDSVNCSVYAPGR